MNDYLTPETLAIAAEHARLAGQPVNQWLTEAINRHATAQTPRVEIPYDDCGFYSPPPRLAA